MCLRKGPRLKAIELRIAKPSGLVQESPTITLLCVLNRRPDAGIDIVDKPSCRRDRDRPRLRKPRAQNDKAPLGLCGSESRYAGQNSHTEPGGLCSFKPGGFQPRVASLEHTTELTNSILRPSGFCRFSMRARLCLRPHELCIYQPALSPCWILVCISAIPSCTVFSPLPISSQVGLIIVLCHSGH